MEKQAGTTSLRSAAPRWSLDGDKKLLELLQNIHEKVVHKCKETNSMFDEMMTSLDEANIDVQSVNDRFMSLSNSQFVESRVYSDDADLTTEPTVKPSPAPATPRSPLARVKASLQQLESHHDLLEIYPDTDSDSDDEHIISVVLKPKDVYSERPLPYIIGSANWRNKWHSGTIQSDSESSSIRSRSRVSQYSESGSEPGTQPNWPAQDDTLSSRSLSPPPPPAPPLAPSQIASELAKRLGNITQTPQSPVTYKQPEMDTTRIYKPEAPITGKIFSNEPPPLPKISDTDSDEDDNDIFAELHRSNKGGGFGGEMGGGNLFDNDEIINKPVANVNSTLTQEEYEPELFTPKPQTVNPKDSSENAVKKPVGGISLFGSNKGTESIGAAILKRHQRKSSDEDASDDKPVIKNKPKTTEIKPTSRPENDIFENLFAKSKIKNKSNDKKEKEAVKIVKEPNKEDLFKDDIFDDIDDIFTTNTVTSVKKSESKTKSVFDDDDDELFTDIAITKPVNIETPAQSSAFNNDKGLFDSDDELFSDKIVIESSKKKENIKNAASAARKVKESSIFDESSDDSLFSDVDIIKTSKPIVTKRPDSKTQDETPKTNTQPFSQLSAQTNIEFTNELVTNENKETHNITNILQEVKHVPFQSPSMFDDETDDLFSKTTTVKTNDDQHKSDSLKSDIANIVNEELSDKQHTNFIEDDDFFTDVKKIDDNLIESNNKHEINIDKYYINKQDEILDEPVEDIAKHNKILDNIERQIDEVVTKQYDLDAADLQITFEQEKTKLDLEKSLEESLFKHNEDKQEVLEIFADEPPAFEKPKEPKKSKNINALFDDDSDDEALFFKKEEPVLDDKPELFEPKPDLFGIFQDEPPDFDFTQKDEKITKNTDTTINPSLDKIQSENEVKDAKKIGKLKVNLNINVNTLLPGASPKKTQKPSTDNTNIQTEKPNDKESNTNEISDVKIKPENVSEPDGQIISTETPKTVSFDKNPESNVLDNQLSKQRPRIQVKRRPSSRRARHEAVRKSIRDKQDESNDSTDNSTSIDDHRTKNNEIDVDTTKIYDNVNKIDSVLPKLDLEVPNESLTKEVASEITEQSDIKDETDSQEIKDTESQPISVVSETKQKDVKSKIVYILNDEDIFNTYTSNKKTDEQTNNEQKSKILKIIDDDDEKKTDIKPTVDKPHSINPTKSSLFDDSSDDEALFKPQTKKPVSIFGSDSDEDIFFGKKKETKVEKTKETAVKKALFSDDDDDDLFGAKKTTVPKSSQSSASTSAAESHKVMNDPLTNQEDDYTV